MTEKWSRSEPGSRFSNKWPGHRGNRYRLRLSAMGRQPRPRGWTGYPGGLMQQHSIRPGDRMQHRSSSRVRGHAGRRPAAGDATVMDIDAPAEFKGLREIRTDSSNGSY